MGGKAIKVRINTNLEEWESLLKTATDKTCELIELVDRINNFKLEVKPEIITGEE